MNSSQNLLLKRIFLLHRRYLRLALGRVLKRGFRLIILKSSEIIFFESFITTLMWGLFLRVALLISKCLKLKANHWIPFITETDETHDLLWKPFKCGWLICLTVSLSCNQRDKLSHNFKPFCELPKWLGLVFSLLILIHFLQHWNTLSYTSNTL